MAQKDFANARKLLDRVIANNPGHAEARAVLSQVLSQEDREVGRIANPSYEPGQVSNLPHEDLPAPLAVVRPRVSLSMIVKNEEANLADCLGPVAGLVDEMVIVDTGSTDRTKEVAARFGAKVFDFAWVDSFAAARNESLAHATGEWVLWMDGDDRLDEENRAKLRRLLGNLPAAVRNGDGTVPAGFVMKCLCVPDPEKQTGTVVDHLRLFRNHPNLRWRYRVHEQIIPGVKDLGGSFQWTDVVIQHIGYQNPEVRRGKLDRDLRLLLIQQSEQPDDPFTLFNLGTVYQEMGRVAEALPLLRLSLERSCATDSIVRKLYALVAQCHNHLGKPAEALEACRAGRQHYPEDAEILFQEGTALRHQGETEAAIRLWEQVLQVPPGPHFASMNTALGGYLTRHNLATAYMDLGQFDRALAYWTAALAERADYVPALLGKAELAVKRRRWDELEQVLGCLNEQPRAAVDAAVFRARMHLDRKEFSRARDILESTIAGHPQALWPRVILSHVWLQEGEDWQRAEQSLRNVLALDPEHKEAQRNLEVLLRQLGKCA